MIDSEQMFTADETRASGRTYTSIVTSWASEPDADGNALYVTTTTVRMPADEARNIKDPTVRKYAVDPQTVEVVYSVTHRYTRPMLAHRERFRREQGLPADMPAWWPR